MKRKKILGISVIVAAALGCLGISLCVWLWQKPHAAEKQQEAKESTEAQKAPEVTVNEDGIGEVDVSGTVEDFLSGIAGEN